MEGERVQLSRFVVVYPAVREDENVLYSVLDRRPVGVDDALLELVRRVDAGAPPDGEEEGAALRELAAQGFLVADRAADDRRLREHFARVAGGIPGTMYVSLLPTLACNLACTYCFQNGSPAYNRMTAETEAATLEFLLRKVDEAGTPKLLVHYFGGEPLTRKDFVLRTAEVLAASMAARGGTFAWEITTNGIELDLPFVQAMNRFGEGMIKVTLDGDRETHDRARVYRSGKGTFDVIFENVVAVALAGATRLRVGGNFLPGQEASYARLVERLDQAGVLGKLEAVKFKPVLETAANTGTTCPTADADVQVEAQTLIGLDRLVRSKRRSEVRSDTLGALPSMCELHWDNQYVIDPDGLVYKCPAIAGRPEVAVGSVTDRDLRGAPLLELRPWEQCGDCAYLPVCAGGCLGVQYLKTGRRDEVNCKKALLEASLGETVPRRYLEELGAVPWDGEGSAASSPST
jgi:uncharacterized protein